MLFHYLSSSSCIAKEGRILHAPLSEQALRVWKTLVSSASACSADADYAVQLGTLSVAWACLHWLHWLSFYVLLALQGQLELWLHLTSCWPFWLGPSSFQLH